MDCAVAAGDEELPHIFLAPETGVPKWNDRHAELYRMTCETQLKLCPAFQVGAAPPRPLRARRSGPVCFTCSRVLARDRPQLGVFFF